MRFWIVDLVSLITFLVREAWRHADHKPWICVLAVVCVVMTTGLIDNVQRYKTVCQEVA